MLEPPPPTILTELYSLINSIQSQLSLLPTSGPTSHLTHPLGPIQSAFLPDSFSTSLTQIRNTANKFQNSIQSHPAPPPSASHGPPTKAPADPVKNYLALLAESATSISALKSSALALDQAKLAYERATADASLELPSWNRSLSGAGRSLGVLECVGKAVGLDAYHDPSETGPTVQLSLGGKCSAVDIALDASTGAVTGTKVSYFLPEPIGHREDEAVAAELRELLTGLESDATGPESLRNFVSVLREVRRLDLLTEASGRDGYRQATAFASELKDAVASAVAGTVVVPTGSSMAPHIVFHASPLARMCTEWDIAEVSGWNDEELVEDVSKAGGANAVRVTLEEAGAEGVAEGGSASSSTTPRFLARFLPPIPITKRTGKRIHALLHPTTPVAAASSSAPPLPNTANPIGSNQTWYEDLFASCSRHASDPITRFNPSDTFEVPLEGAGFTPSFRLAGAGTVAGFLCSEVRVAKTEELVQALRILREQLLLNNLVESVFTAEFKVSALPTSRFKARAAAAAAGPVDLDALFDSPAHPTLPVHVHLSHTSPSLALSFPSPHTPAHEAFPITVTFEVEDGGLKARLDVPETAEGEEVGRRVGEQGLGRVAREGGDLGLVVRWVAGRLGC